MASTADAWHYTVRSGEPTSAPEEAPPDKPPYRVPTMAEVEAIPWNGLTVASTFAGGGGSCTGYRLAGFRVAWASEFEPAAAETYRLNHPDTILDTRDVRDVKGAEILEAVGGPVDVLDGSPPCQAFSLAGSRQRSWGRVMDHVDGTHQRSDDLFFDYARLVGEVRPRAFVAENVAGLVTGVAKGYFKEILRALKAQGYRVQARVLDAQWLGVPQARRRVFFVGLRDDEPGAYEFPTPWPYRYSVAEACPWIVDAALEYQGHGFERATKDAAEEPSTAILANNQRVDGIRVVTAYGGRLGTRVEYDVDEPSPTVLTPPKIWVHSDAEPKGDDRWARSVGPDEPAPTVLAQHAGWSGVAVDRRKLTIPEVVRICSFPDDYRLPGTYAQQWVRLGNSVPPLMMRAVAERLAAALS